MDSSNISSSPAGATEPVLLKAQGVSWGLRSKAGLPLLSLCAEMTMAFGPVDFKV